MRVKFETLFRGYIVLLLVVLLWAIWAEAAAVTNAPPPEPTKPVNVLTEILDTNKQFLLTFGLDQYESLRKPILGNPAWKYLSFLIYILLAWLASRLVDAIFQKVIKRWAEKTESKLDDLLVDLMHGPVKVITFVILLHVGLNVFDWPEWMSKYLSRGLKLVVAWSVTYMAVRTVDVLMKYLRDRAKEEDRAFDAQLFPVISKGLKIFIVLVAVLVTAQNLDFNITGLLASLSIGGLAIGLAAQDTLSNVFGAIAIFLDKPFRVGDRIQLDNIDGHVETIGLRSTRIRNLDGFLVTVPNKTMGNATITNVSRRPTIRTVMNIGVTYDTSNEKLQRAIEIIEEVYKSHPQTHDLVVGFDKFESSSLNIRVVHWYKGTDYKTYLRDLQSMNMSLKARFDQEHIEFAFPTQTIYVKNE